MSVGWAVIFLEARVLFALSKLTLNHAVEVLLSEDTVLGNPVVHSCWLVVVKVLEVRSIGVAEKEGHESVTIVDSVDLFSLQESKNVILNDWVLGHRS